MLYSYKTKSINTVNAADATYTVRFAVEMKTGKSWEFDAMSDAITQTETKPTGMVEIYAVPATGTMKFLEDADRKTRYLVDIDRAREIFKMVRDEKPQFWYLLDMCAYMERRHQATKCRK